MLARSSIPSLCLVDTVTAGLLKLYWSYNSTVVDVNLGLDLSAYEQGLSTSFAFSFWTPLPRKEAKAMNQFIFDQYFRH